MLKRGNQGCCPAAADDVTVGPFYGKVSHYCMGRISSVTSSGFLVCFSFTAPYLSYQCSPPNIFQNLKS